MQPLVSQCVSLDLWDTILRRKCHPDEVKLFTAQKMLHLVLPYLEKKTFSTLDLLKRRQDVEFKIGNAQRQNGNDDEYEIEEVLRKCIHDIVPSPIATSLLDTITMQLVQAEIEQEIAVTYLDKALIRYLQSCEFEKLVITSDFYMSAEKVDTILAVHSFPFAIEATFISCDIKRNKRSGRLFQHVCTTLNLDTDHLVHIGDNFHSDVTMAKKNNIRAVHFTGSEEEKKRKKYHAFFSLRQNVDAHPNITALSKHIGQDKNTSTNLTSEQQQLISYGRYMSPVFTGFALYVQELCNIKKHNRVHFFTREGKFFKAVFDRAQSYGLYGMNPVTSNLLPVSRLATFFPSLHALTIDEMMRMWSQYNTQSINSFLRSLGVEPQRFLADILRYEIDPEEMIKNPWEMEQFISVFHDEVFQNKLKKEYTSKRNNLISYFSECQFGKNKRACIVDIGWRGTIQDNLALIFPEITIDGCYLGLQDFFNKQPDNTSKYGYIADMNKGEEHIMLKYVMPFEMLCFGNGGSAIGYKKEASGRIFPEYQYDPEEDRIHDQCITYFQQGVLEGVDNVCKLVAQHGISIQELRDEARILATDFLKRPSAAICRAFNALKQDDTFGMARTLYPGDNSFRITDRLLSYFSIKRRERFLFDLEMSGWPQCLLKTRYLGVFHIAGSLKRALLRKKVEDPGK